MPRDEYLTWTPEMDRTLNRIVEESPDSTWIDRAVEISAALGIPVTDDMASKRYKRVQQAIKLTEVAPPPEPIEVPEQPQHRFVGFNMAYFDIETTGLGAHGNEMTVAAIADQWGEVKIRDKFEFQQRNVLDDKGLVVWLRDTLEDFDILVAWYGTQFDLSFLNAKLVQHGEKPVRDMMFLDPIYKARGGRYGLKVGGSSLENVGRWLKTPHQKLHVDWETFRLAGYGDPEALQTVRRRCTLDVLEMRDVFAYFKPMIRTIHR